MVDWSKAPEGAEYYGRAADWNFDTYFMFIGESLYWFKGEQWALFSSDKYYERSVQQVSHMQKRPDGIAQSINSAPYVGYSHMGGYPTLPLDFVAKAIAKSHKTAAESAIKQPTTNKYDRVIHGKHGTGQCTVDVYRVLNAFGPLSPEIDHSIKKLLAAGQRGHKDEKQDLLEAIQSIESRLQYLEVVNG